MHIRTRTRMHMSRLSTARTRTETSMMQLRKPILTTLTHHRHDH